MSGLLLQLALHCGKDDGQRVDLGLHAEKPKNFFARAGKGGVARAIYIGPDDIARGTVRIKNLADRAETETVIATLTAPTP